VRQRLSQGKGNSVNMAFVAALLGFLLLGTYCATKHAILGLTRAMALELRDQNIRANQLSQLAGKGNSYDSKTSFLCIRWKHQQHLDYDNGSHRIDGIRV